MIDNCKSKRHRRFPAEWEEDSYILLALPAAHTDWNYILEEAEMQYIRLVTALYEAGETILMICPSEEVLVSLGLRDIVIPIVVPYNDTWTRDYGPISVRSDKEWRLLDFGFNGWGLKFAADRDNLVNSCMECRGWFADKIYRNCTGYVLEGGAVETDGEGVLLTTSRCLCSPNRNGGLGKDQVNEYLVHTLGVDHVLWLDFGALTGDDTDSHIDTLARMAPNNTILYVGAHSDDEQKEELTLMRRQLGAFRTPDGDLYNLVELPLPDAIYDEDGARLPATYANYLITPRNIFIPVYGQPTNDRLAVMTIHSVFPDKTPIQVDCRTMIKQHGSLHCATMQIPKSLIKLQ